MSKLIYCATPSRLSQHSELISRFVADQGFGPLHPFVALPYELFEGGRIGRERSMEYCFRLVDVADEFWMFGVSNGTLQEAVRAIRSGKPVSLHFQDWNPGDPEWKKFYEKLGHTYGMPLDELLRSEK